MMPVSTVHVLFLLIVAALAPGWRFPQMVDPVGVSIVAEFTAATGSYPNGPLAMDASGNLYGTAEIGGNAGCLGFGCGTAFKLTRGAGGYALSTIHYFGTDQDGDPMGGVIVDGYGNVYGTTYFGPPNIHGLTGTVFRLEPTDSGYQETVLYTFQGGSDGSGPIESLVADSTGTLYGVTAKGGASCGCGTVYELSPGRSGYTERVLYPFKGFNFDGQTPSSPVLLDARGDIFGVTELGGSTACSGNGCGIAYELIRSKSGYTERILHAFTGGVDGAFPSGALTSSATGNLYGATLSGGRGCVPTGCGTIFVLSRSASGFQEHVLYAFGGGSDGVSPNGDLTLDSSQRIFGTTKYDGRRQCLHSKRPACGTIFELLRGRNGYSERVVHYFSNPASGDVPMPGLVLGANGLSYGTTAGGGDLACNDTLPGCGTVYAATLP